MQAEENTNNVAAINIPNWSLSKQTLLNADLEVRRTRKTLVVIGGVCLVLFVCGLIDAIFTSTIRYCLIPNTRLEEIGEFLIEIFLYALTLFCAYRYSETGLRVFAWLGVIELICLGFVILILIPGIFRLPEKNSIDKYSTTSLQNIERVNKKRYGPFFCACVYITDFILTIIIVKLTFKLSKLIAAKKANLIQQTQRAIYSII
ncbi:unnamed protein product [Rotaria sp. Silwood2]|nr:unnamed protein product [Rotaria sp. Silwood2]CAF2966443.1 unnamed protein product [Rotaria sp. Silwood2]CAF4122045.1 unnamed protein product [Rotaria sp. Silwood2]